MLKNVIRGGVKYAHYAGAKYGEEKKESFANADIFVFPTYYSNECFPLVLLEAMQYKLPIVTTTEGGIRDIVTNDTNGIVCERKDATSIADAIEQLLTDKKKRQEFGNNGYIKFRNEFTLQKFESYITKILIENANNA